VLRRRLVGNILLEEELVSTVEEVSSVTSLSFATDVRHCLSVCHGC
jgi:hypothetical protein